MNDVVINFIRKYAVVSLLAILASITILFIFNNTIYIVSSGQTFSAKSMENNDKESNIFHISSIYVIPNNATLVKFESSTEADIPSQEIIKPLSREDLGLGVRKLDLKFSNQYELVSNSRADSGCIQGSYPNILDYTCSAAEKLLVYDASKPLDNGKYVSLPQTVISSYINPRADTERTLDSDPYKDGVLSLVAFNPRNDSPPLNDAKLKYIDQFGAVTDMNLPNSLGSFEDGKYQLLTDSGGGENFVIIDTESNKLMIYSSTKEQPMIVDMVSEDSPLIGVMCDLNNSLLACYKGPLSDHAHSDEEDEAIKSLEDGTVSLIDTKTGKTLSEHKISKENILTELCVDKYKRVYTSNEDSTLNILSTDNNKGSVNPFIKADALSCGNNVHFTNSNKLYSIQEDGTAHLVYASDLVKANSVQIHKENIFISGSYKSIPSARFTFTAKPRNEPYTKQRMSDVIASIIEKHGKDVSFEARFTGNSIDYIVMKKFTPNGMVADQEGIDKLINSTKSFDLGLTPTIHNIPS